MFISSIVHLSIVQYMADAERAIEALSSHSIGGSSVQGRSSYHYYYYRYLYLPDSYLTISRSFLGCPNPAPLTVRNPAIASNPNSGFATYRVSSLQPLKDP